MAALLAAGPLAAQPPASIVERSAPAPARIGWDSAGVPHIQAADEASLAYAFGWAQARAHGDLLLRLYGLARGRGAEHWGAAWLEEDRWTHRVGIPGRAESWYAAQSERSRRRLDAFAAGINAYLARNPRAAADSLRVVLPVRGVDVLAHLQRSVHFFVLGGRDAVAALIDDAQRATGDRTNVPFAASPFDATPEAATTTGFVPRTPDALHARLAVRAVGKGRLRDAPAALVVQARLPWDARTTWFESHLVAPGLDLYGGTLVGLPAPLVASGPALAWGLGLGATPASELFDLTLAGAGYRWEGGVRPFVEERVAIRVRGARGAMTTETLVVRRSVHGPVVAERAGHAYALAVSGIDRPDMLDRLWAAARAEEGEGLARTLASLPPASVVWADSTGGVGYALVGVPDRRLLGGGWDVRNGPLRGDAPEWLPGAVLSPDRLPSIVRPAGGWVQSANDAPWTATVPPAIDPLGFPASIAPGRVPSFHAAAWARRLARDGAMTLEELAAVPADTRLEAAEELVPDLDRAVRRYGSERAKAAAAVLVRWDRRADPESRGGVLFEAWLRRYLAAVPPKTRYARLWSEGEPLRARELGRAELAAALLDSAAARLEQEGRALDEPWGETHRLRFDGRDLPVGGASEMLGARRALEFASPLGVADTTRVRGAVGGDGFTLVAGVGPDAATYAQLPFGNATQPGSRHRADQLDRAATGKLRRVWRSPTDVARHLELREDVPIPAGLAAPRIDR